MKMSRKYGNNNKINSTSIITTLIFILVLSVMTVGFALSPYTQLLSISEDLNLKGNGTVYISNIVLSRSSNVQSSNPPTYDGQNVEFHVTFRGRNGNNQQYYAEYQIDITNDSYYDYTYEGFNYNPTVQTIQGNARAQANVTTSGLQPGDIISPKTTEVLTVRIAITIVSGNANNSIFSTDVTGDVEAEVVPPGGITAMLNNTTGDLSGSNTRAQFSVSVISTYSYAKQFELRIGDSNFKLVDANGNALGQLTIPANGNQTYTFYIVDVPGAVFLTTTQTTSMTLISNGTNPVSLGNVTLTVDLNVVVDEDPPTVGNASLSQSSTEGEGIASWDRIDSGGTAIRNYTLILYNSSGSTIGTYNTNSDATTYTFTGLSEDTGYYFVVYGEDAASNSGASSASSATTANGFATRSNTQTMDWRVTVTNNLSNMTSDGANTALRGQNYTCRLSATGNYNLPNNITVTMGGTQLTSGTGYTYSNSTGNVTIYNVSGNINITATATGGGICLIEGTKVLLANGKYKNIEDINYYDLLLVQDYSTGNLIEEYPIWIEKEHRIGEYQLNTFSDGSTLKTVGYHGVFSYDKQEFISVDNKKDFKVGTTVAKYNPSTKSMEPVKVTNIEYVKEDVTYHHVVSTRFYNIISDNILTTDGTVILSNLYGFNKNITWTDISKMVQSNNDYLYNYEDLDILPYYMYKGLRAKEGKWLQQFGLDLNTFKGYLYLNQMNPDMLLEYPSKDGKYIFPVGTSEYSTKYLSEGSIYTIPSPKYPLIFKYYINTTDGTIYYPGDKIVVDTPTYLKAIY